MTQAHHTRDHAAWSASASDRRWACAGSLALEAGAPDVEGEAAAWGTACHELSERALRSDKDAIAFLGETIKTKAHSFDVDEEMAECAQVYIDYVRERGMAEGARTLIEEKFSLEAINPPIQAGGTADTVIVNPAEDLVEVIDLKTGRGVVVEAVENKQLRTYALGVLLTLKPSVSRIRVTVVQPRAPHRDGRIRSETFSVIDLMDWTADLLTAMGKAQSARQFHAGGYVIDEFLTPGQHCQFCKASATCPALRQKALAEAGTFFEPETGDLAAPPDPETLDVPKIVRILDHADMIGNWLNAVRAHAQRLVEAGVDVTDGSSSYVLTPKRAIRKWRETVENPLTGEMEPMLVAPTLASLTSRPEEDFLHEPKPLTPAQVEKLLGKKAYQAAAADLVVQESSGFNLTRADKTTRAIEAPVKTFFQPET